jgi:hypothetical protein
MVKTDPPGAVIQVNNQPPVRSPSAFEDLAPGPATIQVSLDGYDPQTLTASIEPNKLTSFGHIKLERSKGALLISSQPDGLTYELRSRANPLEVTRGVTPIHAAELPTGEYDITVSRDGWPTQRQSITVRSHDSHEAKFAFTGGTVTLTSEPPGADVLEEGAVIGQTPLTVPDLKPGAYRYTVSMTGYEPVNLEANVAPGEPTELPPVVLKKMVAKAKSSTSRSSSSRRSDDDNRSSGGTGHKIKQGFKRAFGF